MFVLKKSEGKKCSKISCKYICIHIVPPESSIKLADFESFEESELDKVSSQIVCFLDLDCDQSLSLKSIVDANEYLITREDCTDFVKINEDKLLGAVKDSIKRHKSFKLFRFIAIIIVILILLFLYFFVLI